MDVREKLVELIEQSGACFDCSPVAGYEKDEIEKIASHLVAHGVTVQGEIDANTYQLMRECERLKEQNENLGNAVNVLEEINSDLCKQIKGVTVQEWISVKKRTPTEADGTVWVCLANVFPYNEKEPYIDAKHDRRITEAFYSQFSKRWYKDGAVFPDGVVTHWMEKAQPPKGE